MFSNFFSHGKFYEYQHVCFLFEHDYLLKLELDTIILLYKYGQAIVSQCWPRDRSIDDFASADSCWLIIEHFWNS